MKNLLIAILFLLPLSLFSQEEEKIPFTDHLVPHFGIMYEYTIVTEKSPPPNRVPDKATFPIVNIHFGSYYVLAHRNDVMSVGIDPSIHFGLVLGQDISWMAQVPVFLLGRIGSKSTKYNQQALGLGLGVGIIYTKFKLGGATPGQLDPSTSFINPAFVAEVNLNTGGRPFSARVHVALSKPTYDVPITDPLGTFQIPPVPYTYNNFGLGIIYGF